MSIEEQMMQAIVAGRQDAYARAVHQYGRLIAAYAYRLLGNQAEAEDVAQETFLKLWTQAARWDPARGNVSAWLHRIAHNLCVDNLRKRSAQAIDADLDSVIDTGAAAADLGLAAQRQHERLQQLIGGLPERQRSALILVHYQGLSNQQAADVLDVSVDALESLLARARRALKSQMSAEDK